MLLGEPAHCAELLDQRAQIPQEVCRNVTSVHLEDAVFAVLQPVTLVSGEPSGPELSPESSEGRVHFPSRIAQSTIDL